MSNKFKNIPKDEGVLRKVPKEMKLGKFDVLHEHWSWEGIVAESFIFANEDIVGVSDEELKALVEKSDKFDLGSQILIKRLEKGFTFVNFNFEVV